MKTVDKNKAGHKAESFDRNVAKWEEAKKGREMGNRGCEGDSDSDSDSDSSDSSSSLHPKQQIVKNNCTYIALSIYS